MAIKHRIVKDFQLLIDKKIIILKAKTILDNYRYITKNDNITVERDIVDNNPDYFSLISWKEELNSYLKQNKIPQPAIITKKMIPFIEDMFIIQNISPTSTDLNSSINEIELLSKINKIDAMEKYLKTESEKISSKEIELELKEKEILEKDKQLNIIKEKTDKYDIYLNKKAEELDERYSELNINESKMKSKLEQSVKLIDKDIIINVIRKFQHDWNRESLNQIIGEINNL